MMIIPTDLYESKRGLITSSASARQVADGHAKEAGDGGDEDDQWEDVEDEDDVDEPEEGTAR